jgi:hypothetical protein
MSDNRGQGASETTTFAESGRGWTDRPASPACPLADTRPPADLRNGLTLAYSSLDFTCHSFQPCRIGRARNHRA